MNITEAELEKLLTTTSVNAWNATCDEIKKARNGQYPPDWWDKVIVSGLAAKANRQWR